MQCHSELTVVGLPDTVLEAGTLLEDGRRSGQPRKVSAETMQCLYEAIAMGYPRQFQLVFCLWTRNIVRTVLKKEKGVELSKSAVCRLLQYMGLTPQRPIHRS